MWGIRRKLTRVQTYILYALGYWLEEANKKIKKKHLELAITKMVFIEVMEEAGLAGKGVRALYHNLEDLEKKKLISYKNRRLKLTEKGKKIYRKIKKNLKPYFRLVEKVKKKELTDYTKKKVQTVFKI